MTSDPSSRPSERDARDDGDATAALSSSSSSSRNGQPQYLEIGGPSLGRRIWGWALWIALFAVVAGLLVLVFVRFTASYRLAFGLVLFMVAYMVLMGWFASRNDERRDERRGDEIRE